MWIATGDIETLDQTSNSVILEAAFIRIDSTSIGSREILSRVVEAVRNINLCRRMGDIYSYYDDRMLFQIKIVNFSFVDQVMLKRSMDPGTFGWHCQTPERSEAFRESMRLCSSAQSLHHSLRAIREFLIDCKELWFNGLSFDPPNLNGLARQANESPLWPFRIECDIRTIYKKFKDNPDDVNPRDIPSHMALNDALRNLINLHNLHRASESEEGIRLRPEIVTTQN